MEMTRLRRLDITELGRGLIRLTTKYRLRCATYCFKTKIILEVGMDHRDEGYEQANEV